MESLWVYISWAMPNSAAEPASTVRVLFIEKCDQSAAPVISLLEASDRAVFRIFRSPAVPDPRRDERAPQTVDRLTHLPNRAAFYDRLGDLLQVTRQNAQTVAAMLINLEGFKLVHNTLGSAIGDPLLKEIAGRLVGSLQGLLKP